MIHDKYVRNSKSLLAYSKPYSRRISSLNMHIDYFPRKFQYFDGRVNPNQHTTYLVETCNNVRNKMRSSSQIAYMIYQTKCFRLVNWLVPSINWQLKSTWSWVFELLLPHATNSKNNWVESNKAMEGWTSYQSHQ